MNGEQRIPASREAVWAALNDPNVLKQCIPGCQELEKLADDRMRAVAAIKVGPITARFAGEVTLSDIDPPNGYRIEGEGQGGVAGFAKGGAAVRLTEDGNDTILHYNVSAQIGGKLSQLGGRLIDATAKRLSAAFFKEFAEQVVSGGEQALPASGEKAAVPTTAAAKPATPDRIYPQVGAMPAGLLASAAASARQGGSFRRAIACVLIAFTAALLGYIYGHAVSLAPAGIGTASSLELWQGVVFGAGVGVIGGSAFLLGHQS